MAYAPSDRHTRAWLLVGAALVLAGLGVAVIREVVAQSERDALEAQLVIAVATHDLYVGAPIRSADLVLRAIPKADAPSALLFTDLAPLVGRTPRERILAGEPIRAERLADSGAGQGLNALLPAGRRAMVLPATAGAGLSGRAAPGNHLDVLVTLPPVNPRARGARWISRTLLRDLRVLAVPEGAGAPGGLTVDVDPWQAEQLALAMARGDVRVALRSDTEPAVTPLRGATAGDGGRARNGAKAMKPARKRGRASVKRPQRPAATPEAPAGARPSPRPRRNVRPRANPGPDAAPRPTGLRIEGMDRAHQTFQADGVGIATVDGASGTLPRRTPSP